MFSCSGYFIFCFVINTYYVLCRLKKHVSDPANPPILIFPEGTCINNTSVMQFKKGSFEVDTVIYPVAIKVIFLSNISNVFYVTFLIPLFKCTVRSKIRRRILEQQSVFDVTLFIYDDVQLGYSLRCMVSPSNVQEGRRECHRFCESSKICDSAARWPCRSPVVC